MIVSLPNVAVNTAPAKNPTVSTSLAAGFLAILANATQGASDTAPAKNAIFENATIGKGTIPGKDSGKNGAKASASSSNPKIQVLALAPATNDAAKIPVNLPITLPLIAASQADPQQTTGDDSDAVNGDEATAVTSSAGTQKEASLVGGQAAQSMTIPGVDAPMSQNAAASMLPVVHEPDESVPDAGEAVNQKVTSNDEPITTPAAKPAKNSSEAKGPAAQVAAMPVIEANPTPHITMPVTLRDSKMSTVPAAAHARPLTADTTATTPVPTIPPANLKLEGLQPAQVSQTAPVQSDSGILPPSSSSRNDGDAAKNPPPSDKSSSAGSGVNSSKANSTDGSKASSVLTGQAIEPARPVVTAPSAPAGADTKVVVPGSSTKGEVASKAAVSGSAATGDTEPVLETAGHFTSPIQIARLVERAGQTEFRVGIQAGELGSVDIRTSMSHNQLSAEISVDRGELGRALSAELPNLHSRLAEQRVPVAHIALQDQSGGNSSGDPRQGSAYRAYGQPDRGPANEEAEPVASVLAAGPMESSNGIDVHM